MWKSYHHCYFLSSVFVSSLVRAGIVCFSLILSPIRIIGSIEGKSCKSFLSIFSGTDSVELNSNNGDNAKVIVADLLIVFFFLQIE